jgi:hypothetical protein
MASSRVPEEKVLTCACGMSMSACGVVPHRRPDSIVRQGAVLLVVIYMLAVSFDEGGEVA